MHVCRCLPGANVCANWERKVETSNLMTIPIFKWAPPNHMNIHFELNITIAIPVRSAHFSRNVLCYTNFPFGLKIFVLPPNVYAYTAIPYTWNNFQYMLDYTHRLFSQIEWKTIQALPCGTIERERKKRSYLFYCWRRQRYSNALAVKEILLEWAIE